jgi:two-component system, cell cycle sensor histidine kinase and response regulator CckA
MASILVVDDNTENLLILQTILGSRGHGVRTAANGREALEKARALPPELVISDILMPVMDGFSLCRQWRADPVLAAVPFIFYTATYTDPRDEELALSLGADLFLVKPQDPEILLRHVQEVLERRRAPAGPARTEAPEEEVVYLQQYNQALVRKLEAKLRQLEEANKALELKDFAIASAISGIALMDPAGRITYANGTFSGMWGCAPSAMAGRDLLSLAEEPGAAATALGSVARDGSWIGELAARRLDGAAFTISLVMHRVVDSQGAPLCIMGSCIDITDQKLMREELQRAQRMESLSLFAAGIAHDFNNLLTGMFAGLQLMGEELPKASSARDSLSIVMSVYSRARDLTQRLLAFAKGGAPMRRKLKVSDLVRESCALSLSGTPLHCTILDEGGDGAIEADPNQLSQVFTNIVINARQAMADQGTLAIAVRRRSITADEPSALSPGDYIAVSFQDSGPGIPDDVAARIFEPFFTTKSTGSGLGLATSYTIVKNHGGLIEVSTRVGAGACFTVWLPVLGEARPEAPREQPQQPSRGTGRVLLMDDEESIRKLGQRILARAGYEVVAAKDGDEAADLARRSAAEMKRFDLAILDLTIRGGMGGEETLAALRAIDPGLPVLASSGYSDVGALDDVKRKGFIGLLPKPYLAHELLSVVKASLGDPRG